MINRLLDILFGCTHANYSFPQSSKRVPCHVTCLECGKVAPYDWKTMKANFYPKKQNQSALFTTAIPISKVPVWSDDTKNY